MERIAIISDVHGNITALNTVLEDIKSRNISRIFCLGDSVTKCANPDKVIDTLRDVCEVMILGNCDAVIAQESINARTFWSRKKIGEERAEFLRNLPVSHDFYMSGRLIRLFHASPQSLSHIYNPMYFNDGARGVPEHCDPMELFENTSFIGKDSNSPTPDVVGYGHIHTPNVLRIKNKLIFNPGSVGIPVEMKNSNCFEESCKFSTVASYAILEGDYNSKNLSAFSVSIVRVPYNIEEEIKSLEESDIPNKKNIIATLRTACP